MRAALSVVAIAALGVTALWWGTEGGQAFTAETARRLDIAAAPRLLPDAELSDQAGGHVLLSDYRGAPVIVEFVYTTCPDICLALGSTFERLAATLPPETPLLSISFDPADDTERLGWFADRYGAEAPRWRVVRVTDEAARNALLTTAGVVVIPDGWGGFVHNAGLYLLDADGRLTAVFDPEDDTGVQTALAQNER